MLMLSREMPCFGSDPSQEVYLIVLVSSGWFNKIPQTRGLEQQKPVSHSPGSREAQGQSTENSVSGERLLLLGYRQHLLASSYWGERLKASSLSPLLIKAQMPSRGLHPPDLIQP